MTIDHYFATIGLQISNKSGDSPRPFVGFVFRRAGGGAPAHFLSMGMSKTEEAKSMENNGFKVGDKVRNAPKIWDDVKKEWTHRGKKVHPYYGVVCTVRSLGVSPTVKILANTNAGYWWIGVDYDEMELVDDDTELTIMR